MITIREYYNKHQLYAEPGDEILNPTYYEIKYDQWIPWLRNITIDEFNRPAFGTIQVAGKTHKQDLMSTLKRIHHKAIDQINDIIRQKQKKEKQRTDIVDGRKGYYWRKRRYKTKPLHQDLEYLKLLEKLLKDSEQWEIVCDEYDMVIAKKLKWRHPYAKDLKGILVLAHLENSDKPPSIKNS